MDKNQSPAQPTRTNIQSPSSARLQRVPSSF